MPQGPIPAGMPNHLGLGMQEPAEQKWMLNSGIPFNFRYRYLVKGWWNNWGYDPTPDGSWARGYMDSCPPGVIPTLQYYCGRGEAPAGEGNFYQKTTVTNTMRTYFSEFRDFLRRCKEYNKPVICLLEADGYAYMQQQSGYNPNAYSAIAATGLPELVGLPNTVAGWGRAFPRMREAVGASKVILGLHVSTWTTGTELMRGSGLNASLQQHVDIGYNFFSQLGLDQYDLLVGDPCDRDADYHRLNTGTDCWWTAANGRANRFATWLKLWNEKAKKRWVLWQIPFGTSNSSNTYNSNQARGGWKDNRSEIFLGAAEGAARRTQFADAGVIGLMFGAGATGQSNHLSDQGTNGQLYFREQARSYLANPLPLPGASVPVPVPIPVPPPVVAVSITPLAANYVLGNLVVVQAKLTNTGGPLPASKLIMTVFRGTEVMQLWNIDIAAGATSVNNTLTYTTARSGKMRLEAKVVNAATNASYFSTSGLATYTIRCSDCPELQP